ncbi:MAG TPA: LacI family DNA-binding transcriptional regulator [Jiangellaceae bacterium]|nr:LacI family DNA-binding transcriptional regulator [Jiangellaceae bacterium]
MSGRAERAGKVPIATNMQDVAARAGVSQRTVSNVVRGYVHVRPSTRERVQRAIEELGYRPNPSARSLRAGRTGIIGLAVPEIAAPYFAELADHIQRAAAERGLTLLVEQTGADRERELLALQGHRGHVIDGLILSPMAISADDLAGHEPGLPTVLLGERISEGRLLDVAIDNVEAARVATEHLLTTGRSRVAAIGADVTTNNVGPALRRLQGYRDALAGAELATDPRLEVTTGGWDRRSGYAAVDRLLRSGVVVDALFCFNDMLALGAIRAISDRGLTVPGDLAVVGWDDIEEAQFSVPSLSSISPDKAGIAATAIDGLLAQLDQAPAGPLQVTCEHRLVVRESTAPRGTSSARVAPPTAADKRIHDGSLTAH